MSKPLASNVSAKPARKTSPGDASVNADPAEIARFGGLAARWWDADGEFRPLHQLGPARLQFIRGTIIQALGLEDAGLKPLKSIRLLDIGSGGGLVSEPLARLGAQVTGIDLAEESVAAAHAHATAGGLMIDYRVQSIEDLADSGERFDAAVCLEVVEHVPDPGAFLKTAAQALEPGGVLIASTLSRTLKSYALAILGAEYVLRWVPRGTHQWDRFLTPDELSEHLNAAGLTPIRTSGLTYEPRSGRWSLSNDTDVNYLIGAKKLEPSRAPQ
ncbi:MAG TPA: bifunctional 2-polyprenyl-6-hydroxyphenol methylase/3-demethylubiquinol 3-O-methyltransferase UbiG [Hyphomicrobiaceae bacterium]|nr:bifunctional 2-polyprenyl-6-hydroxyphenol methylase/3-demethylubiquinol 3-O-methyltransferase UbiG [Hyphomicrobiaceae bacterium]